ncbi:MAG: ferric reductase-like transmembrane domain-containing protein, partial [Kofleriaceae bacterium]
GAIANRAGWVTISLPRPERTGPWMLSRATGVTAFIALSLDVVLGLLMSTRAGDRWLLRAHAIDLHSWLSSVALVLVAGHAIVLLADRYIRFDILDLLVPFASPVRTTAVALGVIAAYLALVVHASFALRRRLGTKTWRRLHYLSFAAFIAAALHAIVGGTDSSYPWLVAVYATPLAIASALVAHRVLSRFRARRSADTR